MADDKTQIPGGEQIPKVPDGFRLVTDVAYKQNAEAGNDLKQLKALIPDGFDINKLKDTLTELQGIKDANKTDLEKLTAKVTAITTGKDTLTDEVKDLKKENRLLKINQIVAGIIADKAVKGNYLAMEFVDNAALAALDPGEGEKFLTNVHEILGKAWERQEEVAGMIRGGAGEATPPVGVAAGAAGAGQGMKGITDLAQEQLQIMQEMQNKGRLGGRTVDPGEKK